MSCDLALRNAFSVQTYNITTGTMYYPTGRDTLLEMTTRDGSRDVEVNKFGFGSNIFVDVRGKPNCLQHLFRKCDYHGSMAKHALRFWRPGMGATSLLSGVYYTTVPLYRLEFAEYTNITSNVPQVRHAETVFDAPNTTSSRPRRLCLE